MRKLLLFVVAAVFALSACSAVDPNPSCSATCHDRYPEQSRDLLDCVSEYSSLNDTNTGDR